MSLRLLLSLLLPFVACGLQWLFWEHLKPYVWFLFFPAAYFSAWVGGLRGGLAGTAISAGLVWYFFIPPQFSLSLENPANIFSIAVFVVMGSLFALFFERLRRAQARNETRFEATFEQAAVGIALLAPDGCWLRVNRRLCDIVGYRSDELMHKTFQDITHPDDLTSDLEYVRQILAGDIASYSLEKRYRRKDGNLIWINLSVALVRTPNGSPDYFISVVEDIQARKEAEADLTEAKRLAKFGHWHWDLRTDRHTWSEEIYRIYGRDPALPAAVYPEVRSYFTAESWGRLAAIVEEAMATGIDYECDAEVIRPDGKNRWITARGEVVRNADGEIVALRGTVQDITERKLAESAIRKGEERYRELVESANSAIVSWSRDGTITFFNDYAQQLFGWTAAEAIGQPVSILQPDNAAGSTNFQGLISDIELNSEHHQYDITKNLCRDGRVIWMSWSNRAMRDERGEITGILAVGNDITERKHAEQELQQRNEELELFNTALVGRELQMIELKRQINELSKLLGRTPPYDISFAETSNPGELAT